MSQRLAAALRRLAILNNWEATAARGDMGHLSAAPCAAVARALGSPQKSMRVVHVAGSKGKGTVAALVGAGVEAAGYRVGVITSPHADAVTERVRFGDGRGLRRIDGDALAPWLDRAADVVFGAADGELAADATWFDTFTAAALAACKERGCDVAVVECGLGGARDSTNFLDAAVAVVASVEVEHADVLGDTEAEIATEKAGIATKGGTLVLGPLGTAARAAAKTVAARRGASVVDADAIPRRVPPSILALQKPFHLANVSVAKAALDALGAPGVRGAKLDDRSALKSARAALPSRAEWLDHLTVVDAAHTPSSVRAFAASLDRRGRDVVVACALKRDKRLEAVAAAIVETLAPRAIVTCAPDGEYYAPRRLAKALDAAGCERVEANDDSPGFAVRRARALATPPIPGKRKSRTRKGPRGTPDALLVVLGSFPLASVARRHLKLDAARAVAKWSTPPGPARQDPSPPGRAD